MATTMGGAIAGQIRFSTVLAEQLLKTAGAGTDNDRTDEKLGTPEANLSVRGNIGDIAQMNHYFYLSARAAGALPGEGDPELRGDCPVDFPGYFQFMSPREAYSAEEALAKLRRVNEEFAKAVESLSDEQLDAPVKMIFGTSPLQHVALNMNLHSGLHLGQAWGILKGARHIDDGFEVLFSARRA